MSKEVKEYDSNRFDDLFYAHAEIYMDNNPLESYGPCDWHDFDFDRMSEFPMDVVRPYVERLLKAHSEGPLLHTIIAVNLECVPIEAKGRKFGFIDKSSIDTTKMPNYMAGLVAACGMDLNLAWDMKYVCTRCQCSIRIPQMIMPTILEMLHAHIGVCEMSMDMRYFKPLTDFWKKCDRKKYIHLLHRAVTETVLIKLGLLMVHPQDYDELPFSVFVRNRRVSLHVVLRSRKRHPQYDDDAINRMAEAGYHTFPNPKQMTWKELTKELKDFARRPISESKITCFSCHHEVTLSNEFVSNPWRYHAQESPKCNFLLMKKGEDYVKEVQESTHNFCQKEKKESTNKTVMELSLKLKPPTPPMGDFFDFCKVVTGQKLTESTVALSPTTMTDCTVCSVEMRNVILIPCLHIATCVDCSFSVRDCPLCRKLINGFMMPLFEPDGSFWMRPECMGGNYFMNLPCRHLIETCVPDNVERCPKAKDVEVDKINCVVCGNVNMARIRVYL
ncbi:hypothetical protein AGLY_015251 [Aphis glycines]|uniref:RING-type domain-containing protein n=1 Tax=Aphis glycines TaxID=307491 RepID=A0A6G0T131_APHGL|nr:hypothetical protein AGLY_015251 [Aphis glycines]